MTYRRFMDILPLTRCDIFILNLLSLERFTQIYKKEKQMLIKDHEERKGRGVRTTSLPMAVIVAANLFMSLPST